MMKEQEYMSCVEAAGQWGVSVRNVQRLLKEGRIVGARKYGRAWMIPKFTEKPQDPRSIRKKGYTKYLLYGELAAAMPMPTEHAELVIQTLPDESYRSQYAAELAYFQGDFDAVKCYYRQIKPEHPMYLCAAVITAAAAMSTGDYALYEKIMSVADGLLIKAEERQEDKKELELTVDMLRALTALSMFVPQMVPAYLKTDDFLDFPVQARPMLIYLRVKYLQVTQEFDRLLTVARTALTLLHAEDGTFTMLELYLLLICGGACYALGEYVEMETYIRRAVQNGLHNKIYTPFAETMLSTGGRLMQLIAAESPEAAVLVKEQAEQTIKNWLAFHNKYAKANITLVLSMEEYQLAVLIREKKSFKEAAALLQITERELHKRMTSIYSKLCIRGKARLRKFIL